MDAFATALAVVLASGVAVLAVRWLPTAVPSGPTAPERVPFLGGGVPEVHAWSRFHVRYYAMALLFLAFDMEMVFMYPWAVVFVEEGAVALVEMLMFIVILVLGILYAWREGALRWA
ncbi:MAG TPA: NADH-quinone oxidoreductase subunit A [Acidimicrobiales bacterium]|jgi:NAD(P)H-quinone oxidoreductase subunit 3|nr:NADH-quinone oxidoreductase subunit A [Acidimicrobiales bacterium]